MIQLTLTLKMITAQVVETSLTINNSSIQDYVNADDHSQPTYEVSKITSIGSVILIIIINVTLTKSVMLIFLIIIIIIFTTVLP